MVKANTAALAAATVAVLLSGVNAANAQQKELGFPKDE